MKPKMMPILSLFSDMLFWNWICSGGSSLKECLKRTAYFQIGIFAILNETGLKNGSQNKVTDLISHEHAARPTAKNSNDRDRNHGGTQHDMAGMEHLGVNSEEGMEHLRML